MRLFYKIMAVLWSLLSLGLLYVLFQIYRQALDISQPMGKIWSDLSVASLQYTQVILERHLGLVMLWQDVILPLLLYPAWLVLLMTFLLTSLINLFFLLKIFSKKKKRILKL